MTKKPLFDLDLSHLSDEHMQHVYRFRDLGKFDRKEYETQRGIYHWKVANKRAMDARDAAMRAAAAPGHEPATDSTQRPRPER